jgi:hypothetical protein
VSEIPEMPTGLLPPELSEEDQQLFDRVVNDLNVAREIFNREARNMRRVRIYFGWMAVALAAAMSASLALAASLSQIVIGVLQVALWAGVALLNFGGPWLAERMVRRRERP